VVADNGRQSIEGPAHRERQSKETSSPEARSGLLHDLGRLVAARAERSDLDAASYRVRLSYTEHLDRALKTPSVTLDEAQQKLAAAACLGAWQEDGFRRRPPMNADVRLALSALDDLVRLLLQR
jgi:hypothetical protein